MTTYPNISSFGIALAAKLQDEVEDSLLARAPGDPALIAKLSRCITDHFERPGEVLSPRIWAFLNRSNIDTIPVLRCFTPWELCVKYPRSVAEEIQQSLALHGLDLRDEMTNRITRVQLIGVNLRDLPIFFVELLVSHRLYIPSLRERGILYGKDFEGRSATELTSITGNSISNSEWRGALARLSALLEVYKIAFRD